MWYAAWQTGCLVGVAWQGVTINVFMWFSSCAGSNLTRADIGFEIKCSYGHMLCFDSTKKINRRHAQQCVLSYRSKTCGVTLRRSGRLHICRRWEKASLYANVPSINMVPALFLHFLGQTQAREGSNLNLLATDGEKTITLFANLFAENREPSHATVERIRLEPRTYSAVEPCITLGGTFVTPLEPCHRYRGSLYSAVEPCSQCRGGTCRPCLYSAVEPCYGRGVHLGHASSHALYASGSVFLAPKHFLIDGGLLLNEETIKDICSPLFVFYNFSRYKGQS